MLQSRQLPTIAAIIAFIAFTMTGCIFASGGSRTSDPADTGSVEDSGPVDARQDVDDTGGEPDAADTSASDDGKGDSVDTGTDCSEDSEAAGCPCEYMGRPGTICRQTYEKRGECRKPDEFVEDEGRDNNGCGDDIDNDCDGAKDEDCPCNYKGKMDGVCEKATRGPDGGSCDEPEDYIKYEESAPADKYCDGKDNDCDGTPDDLNCDSTCSSGSMGEGCSCLYKDKKHGVCFGLKYNEDGVCPEPSDYVSDEYDTVQSGESGYCDQKDNDCNGPVDEGCECDHPKDKGVCKKASRDRAGDCIPEGPYEGGAERTCDDGDDNDCDGQTDCDDSDCQQEACGTGSGAVCEESECTEKNCRDDKDNDKDGDPNCGDSDCVMKTCGETGVPRERRICCPEDNECCANCSGTMVTRRCE